VLDGVRHPQLLIWEESAPRQVRFVVNSTNGLLHLYNVWHDPRCRENMGSQSYTSAMIQEKTSEGFRYRCNDVGFDESFNRLVFRLELNA
jgi:hypothetical protein